MSLDLSYQFEETRPLAQQPNFISWWYLPLGKSPCEQSPRLPWAWMMWTLKLLTQKDLVFILESLIYSLCNFKAINYPL